MPLKEGMTIGCAGLGNMGGAIIKGLAQHFPRERLFGFDRDNDKIAGISHQITPCPDITDLIRKSDILIIAVKPDAVRSLLAEIAPLVDGTLIISIAAGITIGAIEAEIGNTCSIIRVMPNTPALVGEGMTVLSPNTQADGADIAHAEEVFSILGKTLIMPEKYLDAVTAVSGCGPAYGFTIIQAMADAAVELGIPRDKAEILAAQTLKGSAEMVIASGDNPIALRNKVTSPGGSTIAAVHILERAGFSGIMMDAVAEAARISARLGDKK
ncbi:MAG: pyrroline-5-carboxylate reductase [Spirochaetota bacterium]